VLESGSEAVAAAMAADPDWVVSRVAYVETARALAGAGHPEPVAAFEREWPEFAVIELDGEVAEAAVAVGVEDGLRSLDAIHLASALAMAGAEVLFATWDRRLHAAAAARGFALMPAAR